MAHRNNATDPLNPTRVVASYNIHEWVGRDGRRDPDRILRVIHSLSADLIALQEVSLSPPGKEGVHLEDLNRETGMRAIAGPTLNREDSDYGNVLLTALPVHRVRTIDISIGEYEPRGAIFAILDHPGMTIGVVATHLGRRGRERWEQVQRLISEIDARRPDLTILMGDLNEWWPFGRASRLLRSRFGRQPAPATYPSNIPLLSLDRILVDSPGKRIGIRVCKSDLSRRASDHLPIMSTIAIDPSER